MNKVLLLTCLTCIFMCSCNNCSKENKSANIVIPDNTNTNTETDNNKTIYPNETDTITMDIFNRTGSLKIHKEERQTIYPKFNSEDYTKMQGELSSTDSMVNIRFSTITLPDGSTDGPFGRSISYNLPIKGDYLLSIHENQMAGDPWAGDFEVTVLLSK